ncbi:Uncharacterized protein Fot_55915 [Forsythia ovata]|uniref:Uncharacterized protein n=1 Tax=Forsythia ovata TaxID=205694 RepID=A0ABD1P2F5_9LAMI
MAAINQILFNKEPSSPPLPLQLLSSCKPLPNICHNQMLSVSPLTPTNHTLTHFTISNPPSPSLPTSTPSSPPRSPPAFHFNLLISPLANSQTQTPPLLCQSPIHHLQPLPIAHFQY